VSAGGQPRQTPATPPSDPSPPLHAVLASELPGWSFYSDTVTKVELAVLPAGDAGEQSLCVFLSPQADQVSLKPFVCNFQSVCGGGEYSVTGCVAGLEKLQASLGCRGMEESLVLPRIAAFRTTAITAFFTIERQAGGFVYRSRRCSYMAAAPDLRCQACAELFENLDYPENSILEENQNQHVWISGENIEPTNDPSDTTSLLMHEEGCQQEFSNAKLLTLHTSNNHNNSSKLLDNNKKLKSVDCPFCSETLPAAAGRTRQKLRVHVKTYHSQMKLDEKWQKIMNKSVICQACGKSYCSQSSLEAHVKLMHASNTEIDSCYICGKGFKKGGSTLWGHIKTHEDGEHICSICGAKFKVKSYLKRHLKSHDPNSKKFECELCGEKFTRPYLVKQHQEFTHKKNLPFKCLTCGKSLRSKTFLKIHMRSVHAKEKPFPCEICGFRSSRVDNLNIHRTKVHEQSSKITRAQLRQLVMDGNHPFCTNPEDIPEF